MRAWALLAGLVAGCSFNVPGVGLPPTAGGSPGGGGPTSTPVASPTPPTPADDGGAPADLAQQPIGAACVNNGDCGSGFCAHSFATFGGGVSIPNGYCTLDCHNNVQCPTGSVCGHFSFGQFCLSSCPPDPCRGAGYTCCDNGGNRACTPTDLCGKGGGG